MIKKTIHIGNSVYLSTKNQQMVVTYSDGDKAQRTVPVEDLGILVVEDHRSTISFRLLDLLLNNNVAVITCNPKHMPVGMHLPFVGHTEQTERFRYQLEATLPLKKNMWQQTVKSKIQNQAALLTEYGGEANPMLLMAGEVTSGDTLNHEGQAAAYYWRKLIEIPFFNRYRFGEPPNNLLNYGYAILRAIIARSLTGSGLLPALGIKHINKYNAFCLADDIMEPYRPFVDYIVLSIMNRYDDISELNTTLKAELLKLPAIDVRLDGKTSPLLVAASRTSHSVYECFAGISRKILYPEYG
ncbi:MAG: type II CRISPR-associated endonuclease Cas1 [Cyclobacteriaceae bacterium]|nr:type II CRISPR-associated endonuclease Cas1 [Cyclobacteriaceae bacterium]